MGSRTKQTTVIQANTKLYKTQSRLTVSIAKKQNKKLVVVLFCKSNTGDETLEGHIVEQEPNKCHNMTG